MILTLTLKLNGGIHRLLDLDEDDLFSDFVRSLSPKTTPGTRAVPSRNHATIVEMDLAVSK